MSWVMSVASEYGHPKFWILTGDGRVDSVCVEALATEGVPRLNSTARVAYKGEISSWSTVSGDEYLQAFDIAIPVGQMSRHAVFRSQLADGTTLLVPALALIRGLFRPRQMLLSSAFTPSNVDRLAFVDYAKSPPEVVPDAEAESTSTQFESDFRFEPLRWFHTSLSARTCAQSVYENAMAGSLSLRLPKGEFRIALHGVKHGDTVYVTKLSVTSVIVPPCDSISETEQSFVFHGMASSSRKVSSAPKSVVVPLRRDNQVALTDEEWKALEPLFDKGRGNASQRHCRRSLFDAILQKLATDLSWQSVQEASGFGKTILTNTFRLWQLDGRLSRALAELDSIRHD